METKAGKSDVNMENVQKRFDRLQVETRGLQNKEKFDALSAGLEKASGVMAKTRKFLDSLPKLSENKLYMKDHAALSLKLETFEAELFLYRASVAQGFFSMISRIQPNHFNGQAVMERLAAESARGANIIASDGASFTDEATFMVKPEIVSMVDFVNSDRATEPNPKWLSTLNDLFPLQSFQVSAGSAVDYNKVAIVNKSDKIQGMGMIKKVIAGGHTHNGEVFVRALVEAQ